MAWAGDSASLKSPCIPGNTELCHPLTTTTCSSSLGAWCACCSTPEAPQADTIAIPRWRPTNRGLSADCKTIPGIFSYHNSSPDVVFWPAGTGTLACGTGSAKHVSHVTNELPLRHCLKSSLRPMLRSKHRPYLLASCSTQIPDDCFLYDSRHETDRDVHSICGVTVQLIISS